MIFSKGLNFFKLDVKLVQRLEITFVLTGMAYKCLSGP